MKLSGFWGYGESAYLKPRTIFLNNAMSHVSSNWRFNIAIQSIKVEDGMFFEALFWNSP